MDYNAQAKDSSINKQKKSRCDTCKGSGLVMKENLPTCSICSHMLVCTYCNQRGDNPHPYEECKKCWGDGEN